MERFMKDNHSFKDVSVQHESSLRLLHHGMRDLCEPISPDLGKDFETHIEEADRPELLNPHGLCFLRKQSNCSEVQVKQLQLSREKIMEHWEQVPLNDVPALLIKPSGPGALLFFICEIASNTSFSENGAVRISFSSAAS